MTDSGLRELERLRGLGDEAALDVHLRELARRGLLPGERLGRFQALEGEFPIAPEESMQPATWIRGWDHERGHQVSLNVRHRPRHAHFEWVVASFAELGHAKLRVPEWVHVPGGVYLLALERRGPDLGDAATWEGVPRARRLGWVVDAASTLSEVHEAGLHYGGCLPFENFQVSLDDSISLGGLERLGMRSLKPRLTGASDGLPRLDMTTALNPEWATQQGAKGDARTDVWSLGLLLARALTDRFLHAEGAHSVAELCVRLVDEPHPTLKVADVSISDGLDWVALCALERDPARRYPDAGAFGRDLQRALEGREVEVGPPLHLQSFFPRALERIKRLSKR